MPLINSTALLPNPSSTTNLLSTLSQPLSARLFCAVFSEDILDCITPYLHRSDIENLGKCFRGLPTDLSKTCRRVTNTCNREISTFIDHSNLSSYFIDDVICDGKVTVHCDSRFNPVANDVAIAFLQKQSRWHRLVLNPRSGQSLKIDSSVPKRYLLATDDFAQRIIHLIWNFSVFTEQQQSITKSLPNLKSLTWSLGSQTLEPSAFSAYFSNFNQTLRSLKHVRRIRVPMINDTEKLLEFLPFIPIIDVSLHCLCGTDIDKNFNCEFLEKFRLSKQPDCEVTYFERNKITPIQLSGMVGK